MGVRHKRMEQLDGQNSSFIEGEDDYITSQKTIGDMAYWVWSSELFFREREWT